MCEVSDILYIHAGYHICTLDTLSSRASCRYDSAPQRKSYLHFNRLMTYCAGWAVLQRRWGQWRGGDNDNDSDVLPLLKSVSSCMPFDLITQRVPHPDKQDPHRSLSQATRKPDTTALPKWRARAHYKLKVLSKTHICIQSKTYLYILFMYVT